MIAGLRLATGFLTVIPVPVTPEITRPLARTAMLLGWLAVSPVALAAGIAGAAGLALGLPPVVAGAVVVAGMALGTRAMHLDGLADTVDALGSGQDRDKALRILRSGDVGPMGVTALVLALLLQAGSLGAVLALPWGWLYAAVLACAARAALALGCREGVPAARSDGLGALFAAVVPRFAVVALWLGMTCIVATVGWLNGQPWWQGGLAVVVAVVGSGLVLERCVRRLGGMTGDVLGALVETAFTLLVVVSALGLR